MLSLSSSNWTSIDEASPSVVVITSTGTGVVPSAMLALSGFEAKRGEGEVDIACYTKFER